MRRRLLRVSGQPAVLQIDGEILEAELARRGQAGQGSGSVFLREHDRERPAPLPLAERPLRVR